MIKVCPQCSKSFKTYQAKFCCKDCYSQFQKGNDYLAEHRYSGSPWNKGKILGSRVRPIIKECILCRESYTVKPYRRDIAKYCSPKCSQVARDEGKSPLYKRIRKSAQYKQWRKAVFERDDYTCQDCGARNTKGFGKAVVLQADHVKPFALYPELRFELTNGRTLCVDCHKQTDTYGFKAWCVASAQEA